MHLPCAALQPWHTPACRANRRVFVLGPAAPGTASRDRGSAEEASLGKGVLGPQILQGMAAVLQARP